jgi:hypothetical protein
LDYYNFFSLKRNDHECIKSSSFLQQDWYFFCGKCDKRGGISFVKRFSIFPDRRCLRRPMGIRNFPKDLKHYSVSF